MKIFYVITTIERGGAENQLLILVSELVKAGNEIHIFNLKGKSDLKNDFVELGAQVHTNLVKVNIISKIIILRFMISKMKPDIVHAHLPLAEIVARFSIKNNSKYIITRHFGGNFFPGKNKYISSWLGRVASKSASSVIAISNFVEKLLVKNREVYDISKIKTVYYGFNEKIFFNKNYDETQYASRKEKTNLKVIGTVARLSPEKDLDTLITAFANLIKTNPDFELHIAGGGRLENSLKDLCSQLDVTNKVKFLGRINDVPNFLKSLSIFILTSKFEGFGMVLLEAMACKKPIIAANNSAITEVVGKHGAGLFFETSNNSDLLLKIKKILTMSKKEMKYAQKNQIDFFSSKKMAEEVMKIYI